MILLVLYCDALLLTVRTHLQIFQYHLPHRMHLTRVRRQKKLSFKYKKSENQLGMILLAKKKILMIWASPSNGWEYNLCARKCASKFIGLISLPLKISGQQNNMCIINYLRVQASRYSQKHVHLVFFGISQP